MRVLRLPADSARGGQGVPPLGVKRTSRPNGLRVRGSPTTRLMLRGLPVVTLSAQRTKPVPRVRIVRTLSDQLPSAQREVIRHGRRTTAQHAPGMRVQVALAHALPPGPVAPFRRRPAQPVRLALMLSAAATRAGQLRAPGDTARGVGSTWHGGSPPGGGYQPFRPMKSPCAMPSGWPPTRRHITVGHPL